MENFVTVVEAFVLRYEVIIFPWHLVFPLYFPSLLQVDRHDQFIFWRKFVWGTFLLVGSDLQCQVKKKQFHSIFLAKYCGKLVHVLKLLVSCKNLKIAKSSLSELSIKNFPCSCDSPSKSAGILATWMFVFGISTC